jgi:hypothetical protein
VALIWEPSEALLSCLIKCYLPYPTIQQFTFKNKHSLIRLLLTLTPLYPHLRCLGNFLIAWIIKENHRIHQESKQWRQGRFLWRLSTTDLWKWMELFLNVFIALQWWMARYIVARKLPLYHISNNNNNENTYHDSTDRLLQKILSHGRICYIGWSANKQFNRIHISEYGPIMGILSKWKTLASECLI